MGSQSSIRVKRCQIYSLRVFKSTAMFRLVISICLLVAAAESATIKCKQGCTVPLLDACKMTTCEGELCYAIKLVTAGTVTTTASVNDIQKFVAQQALDQTSGQKYYGCAKASEDIKFNGLTLAKGDFSTCKRASIPTPEFSVPGAPEKYGAKDNSFAVATCLDKAECNVDTILTCGAEKSSIALAFLLFALLCEADELTRKSNLH